MIKGPDGNDYIYKEYEKPRGFWREAMVLREINHPFIIKPICMNIDKLGIVLPFIEQGDLTKMPRNITKMELKRFMAQMIIAVHEIHKRGYVHADLKNGNIARTLKPYDHIVLLDFGLAMPFGNITLEVGTDSMMAPEMIYPDNFQNQVHEGLDWWSLGATFWQINCKMHKLKTTFPKDKIIPVNDTVIVSKWDFPDQFEDSLKDLIMKLMTLDSDLRRFTNSNIDKLMGHPFFHDFDWSTIYKNIK